MRTFIAIASIPEISLNIAGVQWLWKPSREGNQAVVNVVVVVDPAAMALTIISSQKVFIEPRLIPQIQFL